MRTASGTATVVGAVAVAMSVYGAGVASADPYAGQTYGDASAAISSYGQTAVVAGRVGSLLPTDQKSMSGAISGRMYSAEGTSIITPRLG